MAHELVLITGVNGFIGYATVVQALHAGYRVRAAARRQEALDLVKQKGASVQPYLASGTLSLVILADICDRAAFAAAAKDCNYIIHMAFPLANRPDNLHQVAVGTVDALLYAAEENPTVRRVVWTSSVAGLYPFEHFVPSAPRNQLMLAGNYDQVPPWTVDNDAPLPEHVSAANPPFERYSYAKTAAQRALRAHKSSKVDIVVIYPSWVIGPHELAQTQEEALDGIGTNSVLLFLYQPYNMNPILGIPLEEEGSQLGATVHVADVAEAHVKGLTVAVPAETRVRGFLMCSDAPFGNRWNDAIPIIQKHYPEEAARMRPDAHYKTIPAKFDCTDTEQELLGRPLKSYETMIHDIMQWYSQLPRTTPYQR